jgi:hypothetical protein
MLEDIRFKFAAQKAYSALHWMLARQKRLDLHAALKACYFADNHNLNKFGRPVFGATYKAMKFGPVPLEIYEMAKGEAIWLAELNVDRFPWEIRGHHLVLTGNSDVDMSSLSQADVESLEYGLRHSLGMTFNERTAATHGRDWQAAHLGTMRYEDMLEDSPRKPDIIEYLQANARFIKL